MEKERKLLKNTIIISIGKIFTQFISFLLLALYTAILTTDEYGTVDLLNTLVYLLVPLITFQIEQSIFRYLIEERDNEENKKIIITNGIYFVIIQCLLYLIFFKIISFKIGNQYKYFLALNVFSYIWLSIFQQFARGVGNNQQYTIGTFVSASFTIIFNLIFLLIFKLAAYGMLIGTFLGQIMGCLYLFFVLKISKYFSYKKFSKSTLKKLLKYSIPLIPNQLSWWIFNASDRIIVSFLLGVAQNGVLAVSSKFASIIILLYNIFDMSWIESISVYINDEDIESFFNKTFNIILKLFTSLALEMIALMPFVYTIIINEKFIDGYYLIPITVIASIFNVEAGLVSVIFAAKKNTKDIAKTSLCAAIVNILVHLLLINFIGIYAATISTLVSFVVLSFYRTYKVKKNYINIKIEKKFLIIALIITALFMITYYINIFFLNITSLIITSIFTFLVNKENIIFILEIILKKFNVKFKYKNGDS